MGVAFLELDYNLLPLIDSTKGKGMLFDIEDSIWRIPQDLITKAVKAAKIFLQNRCFDINDTENNCFCSLILPR